MSVSSSDYLAWREFTATWDEATTAWQDTLAAWEDGPLSVRRTLYAANLASWAGGGIALGTLTRTVTYVDGRTETVQIPGAVGHQLAAADVWVDGDVPFGPKVASITYHLDGRSVTMPAEDRPWEVLSNPFTGEAANVIGTTIGPRSWHSATAVTYRDIRVWDAPMVHSRPEQAPTQELALFTTSRRDREAVARMMSTRSPLLLRSPHTGWDDVWFAIEGDRAEERLAGRLINEEWRRHSWTLHTVPRPDVSTSGRHVSDTLGDLHAAVPTTLGDIAARWATLGDIAMDTLAPEARIAL